MERHRWKLIFFLVLWGFLEQIWNFTFRTQQQNNAFPSRDKILQGKFWRNPACIYILPMQPPRISHSFHWSDWLTHPLPGICKLKAGSCHTPARESASSTGAAPSRSRDQALPKGAELHEPLHVPGETATCWWRTSKLRIWIWEGSGTCRSTSRSWWEPRPVHRRTWKSSELLLLFLHQPHPCSACDVMLYIKAWTEISWKPKFCQREVEDQAPQPWEKRDCLPRGKNPGCQHFTVKTTLHFLLAILSCNYGNYCN